MRQIAMFPTGGLPQALRADFEAFWKAYPPRRPNPRALAEAAFAAVVKAGAKPLDLVMAAHAYAAECTKRGLNQDFIVHASTFLRQARWRDYVAEPTLTDEAPQTPRPTTSCHPLWPLLRGQVDEAVFAVLLSKIAVEEDSAERLVLRAPSRFVASHVRAEFGAALRAGAGGRRVEVLGPEERA